ncbi:MAG: S8 family serine peptidase [Candidatus Sumerlaeia bacterium]|nr:S8 family serine peptidase [Candidatus Sumerlaeia bacterium]
MRALAPAFPAERVSFHNGNGRVDLHLALDQLWVGDSNARGAVKGSIATFETKDRQALELEAASLRASRANAAVRPVLYANDRLGRSDEQAQTLTGRLTVRLAEGQSIEDLASRFNLEVDEEGSKKSQRVSGDIWVLRPASNGLLDALEIANAISADKALARWAAPEVARQYESKARTLPSQNSMPVPPADPLFPSQWHLYNFRQVPDAVSRQDLNIHPVWRYGVLGGGNANQLPGFYSGRQTEVFSGERVLVSVVDDGFEGSHPDLARNARLDLGLDLVDGDFDPASDSASPELVVGDHGTAVAGILGARGNNGDGVTGVAPYVALAGIRLLGGFMTEEMISEAWLYLRFDGDNSPYNNGNIISVSNNSWGPTDTGTSFDPLSELLETALIIGAWDPDVSPDTIGRGAKYVFSAGNGACEGDWVNRDGTASSRYVIAVAASGANSRQSYYSEMGSSILVNAPSSYGTCSNGQTAGITTTDLTGARGYDPGDYTSTFSGTSAAAPMVSGVIALMMDANPKLTTRDVQHILVRSTFHNDPRGGGWFRNKAGFWYNLKYGFGRIDATKAVSLAYRWPGVPYVVNAEVGLQASLEDDDDGSGFAIPDNDANGLVIPFVPEDPFSAPYNMFVEHVELRIVANHEYRGDLNVLITSPQGTTVPVLLANPADFGEDIDFEFTTVAFWGERAQGTWRVRVADTVPINAGLLDNCEITLHGYLFGSATPPTPETPRPTPTPRVGP